MYLTTSKEGREGWYHVRIYSVPRIDLQEDSGLGRAGSMPRHWRYINDENQSGATAFDEGLLDLIGPSRVAIDGELLLGRPEYDTLKCTFKPDPVFFELVNEIRNADREVWIEVVLEQSITDAPPLKHHEMFWPRKKRTWFWGKVLRHDTNGKATSQELQSEGADEIVRTRAGARHDGSLDLAFVHWLRVKCAEDPKEFLLAYRSTFVGAEMRFKMSDFLYKLLEWITPTNLFLVSDDRFICQDVHKDGMESVSRCNFRLSHRFKGDAPLLMTEQLYNLEALIRTNSLYAGVFAYDGTQTPPFLPQYSFFNWKDLGSALFEFAREFFLRFQCELPLMDQTHPNLHPWSASTQNTVMNRTRQPEACARWLFLEVDSEGKRWHGTTRSGTVEYQPAAQWIKKIRIEQPTIDKKFSTYPDGYDEFEYMYEGGQSVTYRTLFRFMGKVWAFDAGTGAQVLTDFPQPYDLWITGTITPFAQPAREVEFLQGATSITSERWTLAHLRNLMALWGGTRAIVKFEAKRIGIEPYGESNDTINAKPVGTFGLYDWGEFPLLRLVDANVGLLFGPDPISSTGVERGEFSIYEIDRLPDGNTKIAMIERGQYTPVDPPEKPIAPPPPDPPDPPDYPPPPRDDPPVIVTMDVTLTHATLSGVATLAGTIDNPQLEPFSHIELFLGGAIIGVAVLHDDLATWTFDFDTTLFQDGSYTLQAKVYKPKRTKLVESLVRLAPGLPQMPVLTPIETDFDCWAPSEPTTVTIANGGGGGSYSDEQAQDAVGAMIADSGAISLVYVDGTPSLTADLIDDGIATAKLADGAVTALKLATDAVETAKIKDLNVTTAKLAADAVTNAKLADDAVETANIKDGNVTYAKLVAAASVQTTPAAPVGTTSSTGVMMGLGGVTNITPATSGRVLIVISGTIKNSTGDSGAKVQARYGTGAAPVNGDALTGTAIGGLVQCHMVASGSTNLPPIAPFSVQAIVSGLSVATTYWIDASLAIITSGTATITDVSISVIEL